MLALSPRHIGTAVDFENIQLFVDYCNGSIMSGNFFSSILSPSTRIICLSMTVEITGPDGVPVMKTFSFNEAEKQVITKLFSDNSWFATFTDRDFFSKYTVEGDEVSKDIVRQIVPAIDKDYIGEVFVLGTALLRVSEAPAEQPLDPAAAPPAA